MNSNRELEDTLKNVLKKNFFEDNLCKFSHVLYMESKNLIAIVSMALYLNWAKLNMV